MAERALAYVVVDVFTDTPLHGNPLAVFPEAQGLDGAAMQALARELNLSETVFVCGDLGAAEVPVRIFTPATELPFAGHPTLGSACVIAERTGARLVRLATGAGVVPVAIGERGTVMSGEMEQPIPRWDAFPFPDELLGALGLSDAVLPIEIYDNGAVHVIVVVESVARIGLLAPDLRALKELGRLGVSCCALADDGRVRTRMFGPGLGVDEDPATGSAAGPLVVHLARRGVVAFGERVIIEQGIEIGRPSRLEAIVEGDGDTITAVRVAGHAVIVADGSFRVGSGSG